MEWEIEEGCYCVRMVMAMKRVLAIRMFMVMEFGKEGCPKGMVAAMEDAHDGKGVLEALIP